MTEPKVQLRPREPHFRSLWSGVGATLFIFVATIATIGGVVTGIDVIASKGELTKYLGIGGAVTIGLGFWWLAFDFCVESLEQRGRVLGLGTRLLILVPAPVLFLVGFGASFLITLGRSLRRVGSVWFWLAFLIATAAAVLVVVFAAMKTLG